MQRGQESLDAVVTTILAALAANDKQAMLAALVSTEEYRDYVIPSSVEPGQAWRVWKEKARQFFADEYRTKNDIVVERLLETYGGKSLQLASWRMTSEAKRYAGYIAHGELRITLKMEPAPELQAPDVLRLGYVAEVAGKFKLLSFVADKD